MRRTRRGTPALVPCSLVLVALAACGGGTRAYGGGGGHAESIAYGSSYGTSADSTDSGGESYDARLSEPAPSPSYAQGSAPVAAAPAARGDDVIARDLERPPLPMLAQAQPPPATEPDDAARRALATATDAVDTSGPLLIYVATFHLAVYEVVESQARIVAAARELGGFVFTQTDDRVVVRVPAPRFQAMLGHVEQAGDVEHREVQAQDVSEEFHDVEIRIRNLEAMRARVAALLAQAQNVEQALQVEQQLARITEELERMRGRQRFLADRIAFSTITVLFRPRPRESIDQPDVVQLPFGWLEQLGLSTLLELR